MNFLKLLKTKKSVFTVNDLKNILDTKKENTIRNYLSRAKKRWFIENLYYWIWKITGRDLNIYEFACKIKKKSYISFETVLKETWVIFQYYWNTIFLASDNSIEKQALWKVFKFCKIKDSILINPLWVEHKWNYSIASKERAICDRLYLNHNYYFDNIDSVDFDKLSEIAKIYNKRVILEVNNLIKKHAKQR